MYVRHQLFIAGMKEELQVKVIEANKPTVRESVYYAIELETTLNEREQKLNFASLAEINLPDIDVDERTMINMYR